MKESKTNPLTIHSLLRKPFDSLLAFAFAATSGWHIHETMSIVRMIVNVDKDLNKHAMKPKIKVGREKSFSPMVQYNSLYIKVRF